MDKISNVIKWANFPENVVSSEGHRNGKVFEVQFTHSNYAKEESIVHDYSRLLKISLITGTILLGVDHTVFAAASSIDIKADQLYKKFIKLAAIIIAFKGGWDILNKALREDFDGAKRISLQYLIVFALILGLPLGLKAVEGLFAE